jgi:hypothetical protein
MDNNLNPELNFDEDKLCYLLENAEKLKLIMSPEELEVLVSALKKDLLKIEETIQILKKQDED